MKRYLPAILAVLVALGMTFSAIGCGNESGTEPGTEPTVDDQQVQDEPVDDDNGKEDPALSAQEQLLYDYYAAIDRHDYQAAYGMCSEKYASGMNYQQFEAMYLEYIKSVKVVSITPLPEFSSPAGEEYRVDFDAVYIKNYPAGSGELPLFHLLVKDPDKPGGWLLDAIGTGP